LDPHWKKNTTGTDHERRGKRLGERGERRRQSKKKKINERGYSIGRLIRVKKVQGELHPQKKGSAGVNKDRLGTKESKTSKAKKKGRSKRKIKGGGRLSNERLGKTG